MRLELETTALSHKILNYQEKVTRNYYIKHLTYYHRFEVSCWGGSFKQYGQSTAGAQESSWIDNLCSVERNVLSVVSAITKLRLFPADMGNSYGQQNNLACIMENMIRSNIGCHQNVESGALPVLRP